VGFFFVFHRRYISCTSVCLSRFFSISLVLNVASALGCELTFMVRFRFLADVLRDELSVDS